MKNRPGLKQYIFAALGVVILVLLDQYTKLLAIAHLKDQSAFVLWNNVFELHYLENRGAAFGIFQNQRWFFVIMTVVILVIVSWFYGRTPVEKRYLPLRICMGGLTGLCSFQWFGLTFMACVIISFGFIKRATQIQETYGNQLKTLKGYARLLAQAEAEAWEAPDLQALTRSLYINGKAPTDALEELSKELDRLDLRNNQFLYVILEGLLFFQLQEIVRIERWKDRYGSYIMGWMEAIGTYDALCSLGTFAYNHPKYTYPGITGTPFCFEARRMGHPLMPETQCVKNDAHIPARPFFLIITGANMAGKSTYLRTIGVNYLLACIGAPVCCDSLTLYPSQLITSLRTSDSLSDNESYFFAELKRLKHIIDLLNEGKELFIILDEILKGTNSMDKQKGSFDLIRQFMQLKANGIIATHDLLLGKLIEQFPDEIRNYCFEADITDNELTFSYRLREGVAQNMNACFLMKKMGIVLQDE